MVGLFTHIVLIQFGQQKSVLIIGRQNNHERLNHKAKRDEMMRIKQVFGVEPMRENEFPVCFCVGSDGITNIEEKMVNFGDHGICEFVIYKGNHVYARLMHRETGAVFYFEEE